MSTLKTWGLIIKDYPEPWEVPEVKREIIMVSLQNSSLCSLPIPECCDGHYRMMMFFFESNPLYYDDESVEELPIIIKRVEAVWVTFDHEGKWNLDPSYGKEFTILLDELKQEIINESEYTVLPDVDMSAAEIAELKRTMKQYIGQMFTIKHLTPWLEKF